MTNETASAEGILAFAENYLLAGMTILNARRADTALHAPSRFLLKHCIELCFKAYLTKSGVEERVLRKKYGHNSVALARISHAVRRIGA